MDVILTRVLLEEINNKEKGDGDFKPQAYQAVVDELKKELGIAINVDHVRNRTKSWKKHYGCIMDIRTYTKFKWDDEKKMIVITMEDLPQWTEYIKENKNAAPYRNKCIENWEDICTLFGADRAVGDGSEQHDEAADVMEGEMVSEGRSSSKDPTNSGSRKRKKDSVAEAVNSFAESFREYVQSKIKDTPRPTCQEIHVVVSQVFGISRSQIMKAVKRLMNGNPDEFLMLKELPEDEKLEWVLLCLAE
ncbi:L10-interacting MYB domain-containing protein [Bienertia sinuspersici]